MGSQLKMMLVVGSLTLDSQNSEFYPSVFLCICREKRKPLKKMVQNIQIYIPFDVGVKLAEHFLGRCGESDRGENETYQENEMNGWRNREQEWGNKMAVLISTPLSHNLIASHYLERRCGSGTHATTLFSFYLKYEMNSG